jgi:WD40 repeat protein
VAFSPDCQLLASASLDHTVKLWDPSTGASRRTLREHSDAVYAVVFSTDGQVLASASRDNTIKLWNPLIGASYRTLEGHSDAVLAVAFSPDGQILASGSADHTVRLWNPSTGASRGTLEGHPRKRVLVLSFEVAFSPDGRLLATSSEGPIYLWDIKSRGIIHTIHTEGSIRHLSFSSNSSYLETNHGIVGITSLTQVESRSQSNSIVCPLRVSGNWVKWGTENILWLPPDYRPIRGCGTAVRYNVLAITYEPGRVIFIEIDPETIPLGESFGYDGQQIV